MVATHSLLWAGNIKYLGAKCKYLLCSAGTHTRGDMSKGLYIFIMKNATLLVTRKRKKEEREREKYPSTVLIIAEVITW